jgi:hypothetical protein
MGASVVPSLLTASRVGPKVGAENANGPLTDRVQLSYTMRSRFPGAMQNFDILSLGRKVLLFGLMGGQGR